MKKHSWIAVVLLVGLILAACAPAATANLFADKAGRVSSEQEMLIAPSAPMEAPAMEAPAPAYDGSTGVASGVNAADRMVVRNANLSIVVKDPSVTMDTIIELAESSGGWVVSSNLYKTYTHDGLEVPQASITIRVPDEQLNRTLDAIKAQVDNKVTDILSENISGEDVTATYTDLESRKRNLEEAEKQLVEIMKNAFKTEDVLNVFNQLTQIRGEIEVLAGQMRYYEESAAYSAISVEIIAQETVKPVTVAGWQPVGVMADALQALIDAGKVIVNIIIWFVIFVLPILVLFYLVIRVIIWIVRKIFFRKNPKKAAAEVQTPETK